MIAVARIVLVMFLWAVCFPLITAGFAYAPHFTFAALRAFLAGAALIGIGMALRRPWPRGGRVWITLVIVGFGATSLGYFGMFMGSEFVLPGIATVIANTQPLMAAGLAGLVLNERLGRVGWTGMALGLGGIVLIALPQLLTTSAQTGSFESGLAYILMAALGITISNVLIRAIAGKVDPIMVYWLWGTILATTELSRANAFSFLVPIFGLAMGAAFFGERLGWIEVAGIGLTLAGIALTNRRGIAAQP